MAASLAASMPPPDFHEVNQWVLDTPAQLTRLRGALTFALTGEPSPAVGGLGTIAEKMVLVASELATNALRHGRPPTTVTLLHNGSEFLLDVADQAVDTVPFVPNDRAPGEGGHGLRLAERLSLGVGWYASPGTKHVWATFPADHIKPLGRHSHSPRTAPKPSS